MRKVKTRSFRDAAEPITGDATVKAKRGRPPKNGHAPRRISLTPDRLRGWHGAVEQALASPRAASTAEALRALLADMAVRLGPHVDPAYIPPEGGTLGAKRPRWRVVQADGTDSVHTTLASAAAAYGAKPASLRVMLSRGGGACRKPVIHAGNESEVRCEIWHETCS